MRENVSSDAIFDARPNGSEVTTSLTLDVGLTGKLAISGRSGSKLIDARRETRQIADSAVGSSGRGNRVARRALRVTDLRSNVTSRIVGAHLSPDGISSCEFSVTLDDERPWPLGPLGNF